MADRTSERISLEELDADLLEELDEDVVPAASPAPSPGSGPRRIAELAPPIPKPAPAPPETEPEPEGRVSSERFDLDSIVAGLGEPRPPVSPSGFPLPSLEPALSPPVSAEKKKSLGWGAMLGVAALSIGVGALAMRMLVSEPEAPVVPTEPTSRELATVTDPEPPPAAPLPAIEPAPVARPEPAAPSAPEAALPETTSREATRTVTPSAPTPARRGRSEARAEAPVEPAAAPAEPRPAEAEPAARTEAPAPAEAPSDLPAQPTRAQVEAAILAVAPAMRQCAATSPGHRATVQFRFVGTSGRAAMATIDASTLDAAQRSCMARAARNARVPPFSEAQLVVAYPLTL